MENVKKKPKKKWFKKGTEALGWEASDTQSHRRKVALRSRGGDYLAAARALQALANVQAKQNPGVAAKARQDAKFFFRMHKIKQGRR